MEKKVVLIVEDKEFLGNVIENNLSDEYDCIRAKDAQGAMASLDKADAAVVSVDVKGKIRDNLLSEIKEKKHIPVIMLTSINTSQIRISLLREGADDVVIKPLNPEELLLRLMRLTKNN